MKFRARQIEKPWGRTELPPEFGATDGRRIGEIWFEPPLATDLPLLVKYIFTSEKLSVQVHPDDQQARQRGHPRGKSECWYILDAEPNAALGLGLHTPLSPHELCEAAVDGSIERLMDWRPVVSGDFFFVPAGTIHAIGAGIALLEFQQNTDLTYRLYDYGRPRELHLGDAVAVARPQAHACSSAGHSHNDIILHDGPEFSFVRVRSADQIPTSFEHRRRWVIPLEGSASSGVEHAASGECLLVEAGEPLTIPDAGVVLIGTDGPLEYPQ